jgi:hypothetical protein
MVAQGRLFARLVCRGAGVGQVHGEDALYHAPFARLPLVLLRPS